MRIAVFLIPLAFVADAGDRAGVFTQVVRSLAPAGRLWLFTATPAARAILLADQRRCEIEHSFRRPRLFPQVAENTSATSVQFRQGHLR